MFFLPRGEVWENYEAALRDRIKALLSDSSPRERTLKHRQKQLLAAHNGIFLPVWCCECGRLKSLRLRDSCKFLTSVDAKMAQKQPKWGERKTSKWSDEVFLLTSFSEVAATNGFRQAEGAWEPRKVFLFYFDWFTEQCRNFWILKEHQQCVILSCRTRGPWWPGRVLPEWNPESKLPPACIRSVLHSLSPEIHRQRSFLVIAHVFLSCSGIFPFSSVVMCLYRGTGSRCLCR